MRIYRAMQRGRGAVERKGSLTNACTQTGLPPEGEESKFDIMVMGKITLGSEPARLGEANR